MITGECYRLAWGGERGLVVVDVTRRELLAALSVSGLHTPPAPAAPAPPAARQQSRSERQRSPSLDQVRRLPPPDPDFPPLPSYTARPLPLICYYLSRFICERVPVDVSLASATSGAISVAWSSTAVPSDDPRRIVSCSVCPPSPQARGRRPAPLDESPRRRPRSLRRSGAPRRADRAGDETEVLLVEDVQPEAPTVQSGPQAESGIRGPSGASARPPALSPRPSGGIFPSPAPTLAP